MSVCFWYICILLYVKLICCSGFAEFYARLEEKVESVCHGYMCISLYVKLISCSGFAKIYARLEEKVYAVCPGYMCILLYVKLIWCNVFQRSIFEWRRGCSQSAMGISVLFNM